MLREIDHHFNAHCSSFLLVWSSNQVSRCKAFGFKEEKIGWDVNVFSSC